MVGWGLEQGAYLQARGQGVLCGVNGRVTFLCVGPVHAVEVTSGQLMNVHVIFPWRSSGF